MSKEKKESAGGKAKTLRLSQLKSGVVNPFALVEIKLKRRIDWNRVADHQKFIQSMLRFPYQKLFDPQHGSPLYPGVRYDIRKKNPGEKREYLGCVGTPGEVEGK